MLNCTLLTDLILRSLSVGGLLTDLILRSFSEGGLITTLKIIDCVNSKP